MYDIANIYEPASVKEAIELLAAHPQAKVLAGGSDILIKVREGKLAGIECVSIYKLDELRGVSLREDGSIEIRPLTSFSHVEANPIIAELLPVLSQAVGMVGGPQIRNIGTIGGNICNGVTSADSASTLLAFDAILEIMGPKGVRQTPISRFYRGPGKVDLGPAELLVAIVIPMESYAGYFGHYIKYAKRKAMDIATLGCSVNVKLCDGNSRLDDVRIALGVAAPTPIRCLNTEDGARGRVLDITLVRDIASGVLEEINPRTSWRATREFRQSLASELVSRAFCEAVKKGGGEIYG